MNFSNVIKYYCWIYCLCYEEGLSKGMGHGCVGLEIEKGKTVHDKEGYQLY